MVNVKKILFKEMHLTDLMIDIIKIIYHYLNPHGYCALRLCCKRLREASTEVLIYQQFRYGWRYHASAAVMAIKLDSAKLLEYASNYEDLREFACNIFESKILTPVFLAISVKQQKNLTKMLQLKHPSFKTLRRLLKAGNYDHYKLLLSYSLENKLDNGTVIRYLLKSNDLNAVKSFVADSPDPGAVVTAIFNEQSAWRISLDDYPNIAEYVYGIDNRGQFLTYDNVKHYIDNLQLLGYNCKDQDFRYLVLRIIDENIGTASGRVYFYNANIDQNTSIGIYVSDYDPDNKYEKLFAHLCDNFSLSDLVGSYDNSQLNCTVLIENDCVNLIKYVTKQNISANTIRHYDNILKVKLPGPKLLTMLHDQGYKFTNEEIAVARRVNKEYLLQLDYKISFKVTQLLKLREASIDKLIAQKFYLSDKFSVNRDTTQEIDYIGSNTDNKTLLPFRTINFYRKIGQLGVKITFICNRERLKDAILTDADAQFLCGRIVKDLD